MSLAEHFIPPDEMGLALLDALSGAEPGTYLAGKDWRTFKVKNGVEILVDLLRPHYGADKLRRFRRASSTTTPRGVVAMEEASPTLSSDSRA